MTMNEIDKLNTSSVAAIATKFLRDSKLGDSIFDSFTTNRPQFIFGKFDEEIVLAAQEVLEELEDKV